MNTKALRQKILDLAIRGKLVPQDPNDEPASVLLERIRAEKQQMVKDGKLKPKDIKNDTVIFKGDDNLHYEQYADGTVKCIEDEIPFDVPNNWEWVRIKTACVINPRNSIDDNTEVSFVPMANIKEGYANKFISDIRVWKKVKKGYTHFANNDIGIAKITPCFENKKSVVFSSLINGYGAGTTELYILRTISSLVIPEYLLNFVKRDDFIAGGVLTFSGDVGQQRVTKDYVANYLFTLPPLNEQQRILNAVHTATSLIESIEKANDNLIRDIDKTKAKILDLAIRGKLVPQDSNNEPASVLLERIRAEKEELIKQGKIKRDKKESVIFKGDDNSYYQDLPSNWIKIRLSTISEIITKGTTPRGGKVAYSQSGIGFLRAENIAGYDKLDLSNLNYVDEESHNNYLKRSILKENDILITIAGTLGRTAIVPQQALPLNTNQAVAIVRLVNNRLINVKYLVYALNSPIIKSDLLAKSVDMAIPNLSLENIADCNISLPPLVEQKRIVDEIEKIFAILDDIANQVA